MGWMGRAVGWGVVRRTCVKVALGGMMEARRGKVGMRLSRRREAFLAAEGLVKGLAFIALPRRFCEVGEGRGGRLGEGER